MTAAAVQCSLVIVTVTAAAKRSFSEPLWRALAVFRFVSVGYAALRLAFIDSGAYSQPGWAWAVVAVMAAWTVVTTIAYARPKRRTKLLLGSDLLFSVAIMLSTLLLQHPVSSAHGAAVVTATWTVGPVLAWAIRYGRRAGTVAGLIVAGFDFALLRHAAVSTSLNGEVLLVLSGWSVGHLARLSAELAAQRQRATEVEAASRERERLARDIHDSVLQVLALVQRRGAEAGGAAAELGRLAGQQEAALRALVSGTWAGGEASGDVDLCQLILPAQTDLVTISVPAPPVLLDGAAAAELTAAVQAALDNVRRHAGEQARAWVLVEEEPHLVRVTIRDDGQGIPDGRLAEAAAAGRLGISHSIRGRLRDLGGSAVISSAAGEGTTVELRLPRPASPGGGPPGTPRDAGPGLPAAPVQGTAKVRT
jgi:signal transduction histidine kinase